jgi:tetratricopeptide (TPR) repeat protein
MRNPFILPILLALTTPALAAPVPTRQIAPQASKELDKLFGQLAKAGSAENAKPIEDKILILFNQSGSPSVDLLMLHAGAAAKAGDAVTAKEIVITITEIAPNFAEGWRQRASLAQSENNDAEALGYLQKAVTLNPREFSALSELGGVLAAYGDKKQALQVFRKAQAIDPYLAGIGKQVNDLTHQVEGDKI